jgi:HK97 family phage major capsid protein
VQESHRARLVGTWGSIAPGEVTEKNRRDYLKSRAEDAMRRAPKQQGRPWSATASLFDRTAPAAVLSGQFASLGEHVQAQYRASNGTGTPIKNAAMSERVPSEGGALVGEELRSELMLHTLEEGIIRPRATIVPMRQPSSRIPVLEEGTDGTGNIFGGLAFAWTEEQAALAPSVASYGLDVLRAKKLIAYMVCPNELFNDANKLDTFLKDVIPAGLAFAEDAAFIAGRGSLGGTTLGASQPLGILNAGCAIQVTRAGSPVSLADIANMATRMLPKSMSKYIWLASPDIFKTLLQIYLSVGSPTTQATTPADWLRYSDEQGCWCMLGRPIFATEHMSAAGTTGDLCAVDPSFYVVGDYQELTIDIATEGTDFINDQSQIRVKARLDGRVWLAQPITPANSSETCSPVVILH